MEKSKDANDVDYSHVGAWWNKPGEVREGETAEDAWRRHHGMKRKKIKKGYDRKGNMYNVLQRINAYMDKHATDPRMAKYDYETSVNPKSSGRYPIADLAVARQRAEAKERQKRIEEEDAARRKGKKNKIENALPIAAIGAGLSAMGKVKALDSVGKISNPLEKSVRRNISKAINDYIEKNS